MKKIIIAFISIILIGCVFWYVRKEINGGLHMSGSCYDNIADFQSTNDGKSFTGNKKEISGIAKSYLQNITYDVKELDKENKTAVLEVSVPDFTDELPEIVSDAVKGNENAEYDELLQIVKSEFEKAISDKDIAKTTETITMSLEEDGGRYRFAVNDQFEQLIFGNFETMITEYYRMMIGELEYEDLK